MQEAAKHDFPDLDVRHPTGAQIAGALRRSILRMETPPGARLSEARLATRFGASRTPVREALSRLRAEGFIETLASRGTFVTLLSEAALRGAYVVREALEHRVAEVLCQQALSADHRDRLLEILTRQRAALDTAGTEAFHAADDAFHLALAEATALPRLPEAIAREKLILDRLRALRLSDDVHLRSLLQQHQQILDAILRRDAAGARAALSENMRGILGILSDLRARHAEYFE